MSYITACVDVVDSTGARVLTPNVNGSYQPFRIKLPLGSLATCTDRGDGTSEVDITQLGEAITSTSVIQFSGDGRTVEQYAAVELNATAKTLYFGTAADLRSKTEVNATIAGGTGILHISAASITGDRVLLNVTFALGDRLIVRGPTGSPIYIDETASAAGVRAYMLVRGGSGWEVWRPAGSVRVNNAPCHSLATGTDFPVSLASGVATLDPLNLIPRSLWRRNQARSTVLASDAAVQYLGIAQVELAGNEGLESLALSAAHTYAAVISSRVTIIETANPQHFAIIDLVAPVRFVGADGNVLLYADAADASVSVVATSTMAEASASITGAGWSILLSVSRPPGVACTVVHHDTAVIELQEVA